MDLLKECVIEYKKLLSYRYHFLLGRKGKSKEFVLTFDEADFHHLAGLHKLKDNAKLQYGKRADILNAILHDEINLEQIKKSVFYDNMAMRLEPLSHLERILDDNQLVFRYNEKVHKYSIIKAEYLLEGYYNTNVVYLFLGERGSENTQMCRTFFPKRDKDYTVGQPRYTLLKKEKIHIQDGKVVYQYNRLSEKEQ